MSDEPRRRQPRRVTRTSAVELVSSGADAASLALAEARGCVAVLLDPAAPLSTPDLAALAAARILADAAQVPLVALASLSVDAASLRPHGVDGVVFAGGDIALAATVSADPFPGVWEALKPVRAVCADRVPGAGVIGRWLASSWGVVANAGLVGLDGDIALCRTPELGSVAAEALGSVVLVDERFPRPPRQRQGKARIVDGVTPSSMVCAVEDLGVTVVPGDALSVEEAPLVMAGGAGVRDWALLRDCARILGASLGASRVAVDAGLAPRDRQVGASGRNVSAEVYIALGISGAIQHLEGIASCQTVISVNTDPDCAMAARADIAIKADAGTVAQALLAKARAGR